MAVNGDGIKLVATDLDGTLLLGGSKEVDPRAFPLIEELLDCGIVFFAASGRQHSSLRALFGPMADRIGYVCENGARVVFRGEVLFERRLPHDEAMAICHAVMEHPACELAISGQDMTYVLAGADALAAHLRRALRNNVTVVARPEDVPEPILKVVFRVPEERRAEIGRRFDGRLVDGYRVVTSGATWLDVIPAGVNKGTALAAVGERLGIAPEQMLAFGDNENDREMLELVGSPYLMDPCNPSMLNMGDRVRRCAVVEDELARLLGR